MSSEDNGVMVVAQMLALMFLGLCAWTLLNAPGGWLDNDSAVTPVVVEESPAAASAMSELSDEALPCPSTPIDAELVRMALEELGNASEKTRGRFEKFVRARSNHADGLWENDLTYDYEGVSYTLEYYENKRVNSTVYMTVKGTFAEGEAFWDRIQDGSITGSADGCVDYANGGGVAHREMNHVEPQYGVPEGLEHHAYWTGTSENESTGRFRPGSYGHGMEGLYKLLTTN